MLSAQQAPPSRPSDDQQQHRPIGTSPNSKRLPEKYPASAQPMPTPNPTRPIKNATSNSVALRFSGGFRLGGQIRRDGLYRRRFDGRFSRNSSSSLGGGVGFLVAGCIGRWIGIRLTDCHFLPAIALPAPTITGRFKGGGNFSELAAPPEFLRQFALKQQALPQEQRHEQEERDADGRQHQRAARRSTFTLCFIGVNGSRISFLCGARRECVRSTTKPPLQVSPRPIAARP